jgi:hypothetical protein
MKSTINSLLVAMLVCALVPQIHSFLAINANTRNGIWRTSQHEQITSLLPRSLQATTSETRFNQITPDVFHDEFEFLIESHPLDDVEPTLPIQRRGPNSPPASFQSKSIIPTDPQEEWKWFYNLLKERNTQDNTTFVKDNILEESLLRQWMAQQRKAFMKSLGVLDCNDKSNWGTPYLTRAQKELLDNVDFPWGHLQPSSLTNDVVFSDEFQKRVRLSYKDWQWNQWYRRLCLFASRHGHTRVSSDGSDNVDLAKWTAEQRTLRRKMPRRRRQRLDDILFDWDWKDSADNSMNDGKTITDIQGIPEKLQRVSFSRRVKELKEYRAKNGNCSVPLDCDLGKWVEETRGRRSKLSPSSIAKLEAIGLRFVDREEE